MTETRVPQSLGGTRARVSVDDPTQGLSQALVYSGAPDQEGFWRANRLDDRTLDRMAPADLIELLCDLSPDISRALWDFQRLTNPGWTCRALRLDGKDVEPRAQAAVDAF